MEEIDIEQTDESVIEGFPDWSKVDNSQLAKLLAERVIYNADNLVAFDKPAGLAYSGLKSSSCVKIESALQDIKKIVAPDCERLNVVESLDKCASGILIFAKSKERQKQLKDMIDQGKVTHRFRGRFKSYFPICILFFSTRERSPRKSNSRHKYPPAQNAPRIRCKVGAIDQEDIRPYFSRDHQIQTR